MRIAVVAVLGLACGKAPEDLAELPADPVIQAPDIPWLDQGEPERAEIAFACPAGWRAITVSSGAQVCDPWPASGRATCPTEHEAHAPGTPGCASVGTTCDASGWPTGLPASDVLFVSADADVGGTGSVEAPFATIADATAVATAGDIVALGTGDYDEPVVLPAGVSLIGACAATTRITASCSTGEAVITMGAGTELHNVTVHDAACAGIRGPDLVAEQVVVHNVHDYGIHVTGDATLDQVLVRDTRGGADDEGDGFGVFAIGAGALTARHLMLEGNQAVGLLAAGAGRTIEVSDLAIIDVTPSAEGDRGRGLSLSTGATGEVHRAVFEATADSAVVVGTSTAMVLEDLVITDTRSTAEGWADGISLLGADGPRVSRVWYHDALGNAVWSQDCTDAVIEDLVVERVQGSGARQASGLFATGGVTRLTRADIWDVDGDPVYVTNGAVADLDHVGIHGSGLDGGNGVSIVAENATVNATRTVIEEGLQIGVLALQDGQFNGTDLVVRRMPGDRETGWDGTGIIADGADVTLTRVLFEDSAATTGLSGMEGSSIEATDTVFRNFSIPFNPYRGEAIRLVRNSEATLERVAISGIPWGGIHTLNRSTANVRDVSVGDLIGGGEGLAGDGLMAWDNSRIEGLAVEVIGARHTGLRTVDNGTIALSSVLVAHTVPMACAATTCAENAHAVGVHAGGGEIRLEDFVIRDNGSVGVATDRGTVELLRGAIAGHAVGTQGTVAVNDDVQFVNNEEDLIIDDELNLLEY